MGALILRTSGGTGGSFVNGATVNLTSNESLVSTPNAEVLGGYLGPQDVGTLNTTFTRTNWTELGSPASDWKYSNTRTLNGTQSLMYNGLVQDVPGNARGTYQYDTGASGFVEDFRSRFIYWQIDVAFPGCQWKMDRWQTRTDHTGGGGPEVVDGYPPSGYITNSTARDNTPFSIFNSTNPQPWNPGDPTTQVGWNTNPSEIVAQNEWVRIDWFMRENTTPGTADGIFQYNVTRVATNTKWTVTLTDRVWRGANDWSNPFRYQILQNYFGNDTDPTTFGNSILYQDQIYLCRSTSRNGASRCRWELIDAATPAASSKPGVIQPWVSKAGTACQIKFFLGYWPSASGKYLVEFGTNGSVVTTVGPLP